MFCKGLKERTALFIIICFGCIPRLWDLTTVSAIELDGIGYAQTAENFARGDIFEGLRGISHPLYPLILGWFSLVTKDYEIAGRIISFIFGIMLIYFSFLFLRKLFGEKKALYASFFIAVHPYLIRYSVQVLSESMTIFLFAAAVFLFYKGWKETDRASVALSGLFLGLTYLNKAEYIIYTAPFCLLLLKERRYSHVCILLFCFSVLAFPYIYHLKLETGLWTVTKKAVVSERIISKEVVLYTYAAPFSSFLGPLKKVPFVAYNFFEAVFPPLFILAVLGFKRVEPSYRMLSIFLVVLHVIARVVFAPHSTRRYSVEFIPIFMVFAVEGVYVLKGFCERYEHKNQLYYGIFTFVITACLFQSITPENRGRTMNKQAGLYLLKAGSGSKIISRLPVAAFYAKGEHVNVVSLPKGCAELDSLIRKEDIGYAIFDEKMEAERAFVATCCPSTRLTKEFGNKNEHLSIYEFIGKSCMP